MTHTPGPWKAESDENGHWVCLPGKDTFICEMAEEVPFEEIGANARLIGAAPTMLEALKTAQAYLLETRTENDSPRAIAVGLAIDHAIAMAESADG